MNDRQAAANKANEKWPLAKRNGLVKAAAAAEAVLETNVRRMMSKGDLPLSIFEIETSSGDRLPNIIWLVKQAGGLAGPARPLSLRARLSCSGGGWVVNR